MEKISASLTPSADRWITIGHCCFLFFVNLNKISLAKNINNFMSISNVTYFSTLVNCRRFSTAQQFDLQWSIYEKLHLHAENFTVLKQHMFTWRYIEVYWWQYNLVICCLGAGFHTIDRTVLFERLKFDLDICETAFIWFNIRVTSQWARWRLKASPASHDCSLNRLFRHRPKKTSKLCVTDLYDRWIPRTKGR